MNAWKRIAIACLSLAVLGAAPAGAAPPPPKVTVTAATPSSAYQGDTLDVVVKGSGFDPSAKVQYFVSGTTNPGGITVRSVKYTNSGELTTTIEVSSTGDLANFDIQVTLGDGRKGKGTTLFSVRAKPNDPPPAPTYPAARHWHAFTSNGGTEAATSRLYMFGGAGGAQLEWQDLSDLWVYTDAGSSGAKWTFVPAGSTAPGPRHHVAWSCSGGYCVLSGGVPRYDETWIFSESSTSWTQLNCSRRGACPTRRYMATMAYDPAAGRHVLFGGEYNWTALGDTWSFSTATMKWSNHGSSSAVAPRSWSAATFVPTIGRVALFGGYDMYAGVFNDMFSWSGNAWVPISQAVDGTLAAVPTLMNHSMAWDPVGNRLIVTGGLKDMMDTPNADTFYVTFTNASGAWRATWTRASGIGCWSSVGSPPDSVVHPQARMAFDIASHTQVIFGGVENLPEVGAWAYGNTVECR